MDKDESLNISFVDAIIAHSRVIKTWLPQSSTLYNEFRYTRIKYNLPNFPYTHNRYIESKLVSMTLDRRKMKDKMIPSYARETVSLLILRLMIAIWSKYLYQCGHDRYCYYDSLVLSTVVNPPGLGIGYLCLLISRNVRLNHYLKDQIDTSYYLSPKLPLSKDEYRSLIDIVGTEDRLRLTLLLIHKFGKLAYRRKTSVKLDNFIEFMWTALNDLTNRETGESNYENIFKDINTSKEILIRGFGEFDIILTALLLSDKCTSLLSLQLFSLQLDSCSDGLSNNLLSPFQKKTESTPEITPVRPSLPDSPFAFSSLDKLPDFSTYVGDPNPCESESWPLLNPPDEDHPDEDKDEGEDEYKSEDYAIFDLEEECETKRKNSTCCSCLNWDRLLC